MTWEPYNQQLEGNERRGIIEWPKVIHKCNLIASFSLSKLYSVLKEPNSTDKLIYIYIYTSR